MAFLREFIADQRERMGNKTVKSRGNLRLLENVAKKEERKKNCVINYNISSSDNRLFMKVLSHLYTQLYVYEWIHATQQQQWRS